jgi:soluble lytic murein transglycosylase
MIGILRLLALALTAAALLASGEARAGLWVFEDARGVIHVRDYRAHDGYKLYKPSAPAKIPPEAYRETLKAPDVFDGAIAHATREHGLSPGLVKAVVHVESAFNPKAVSRAGALGLMQLMPDTARSLGVDDPFNPWHNIEGGTRYLRYLMRKNRGDVELALAAYNAGQRAVEKHRGVPPFPETRQFVKRVMSLSHAYDRHFR